MMPWPRRRTELGDSVEAMFDARRSLARFLTVAAVLLLLPAFAAAAVGAADEPGKTGLGAGGAGAGSYDPESAEAQGFLKARSLKDDNGALKHADKLPAAYPSDATVRFKRARSLAKLGRLEDALEEAKKATELGDPVEGHLEQAILYNRMGRHADAIASADRALERAGEDPESRRPAARAWRQKGQAYELTGNYEKAKAAYATAVDFDADFEDERVGFENRMGQREKGPDWAKRFLFACAAIFALALAASIFTMLHARRGEG